MKRETLSATTSYKSACGRRCNAVAVRSPAPSNRYLDEHYSDKKVNFREHILPRMRDLVRDAILSVRHKLDTANSGRRCFELFGYDFMV